MKERLKRELNKTYLILSSEGDEYEESYEIEMILKNSIEMILPLHVLRIDGDVELYYDVSSKQTIRNCMEREKLSVNMIRCLFETIDKMTVELNEYLLDVENVLLDIDHIYTKEGEFYFCYCPWREGDVLNSFRCLLEDILGNIDYRDTKAVELSYHLYQNACKGDFSIAEILKEHTKEEKTSEMEQYFENDYSEESILTDWEEELEEKEIKQGLFNKIIKFFLKKEQIAPIQCVEEEITYGCTQVLEKNDQTIFLEDMPAGRWKLRPLLPGYEEFVITGDSFLVGKKRDSVDGVIGRETISRIHSRLHIRQERLFISDANSTNGTFVNGISVAPGEEVEIFPGDRILFADVGYECYNSL